jgi:alkylhydroperoxidase/carboxymuconolactone decarboxylase family protein YurZ
MTKVDERVPFFIAKKNSKIGAYANFTLLQNETASLLALYVDCAYQQA